MIFRGSRYLNTKPYKDNSGIVLLQNRKRRKFRDSDCSLYTLVEGDTLDNISTIFYGSPVFYWAILDANPTYMSELDFKAGDTIKIPSYEEVVMNS